MREQLEQERKAELARERAERRDGLRSGIAGQLERERKTDIAKDREDQREELAQVRRDFYKEGR